jgi:DNA-directed RNA polymerase specialized sigma24 family protein
MTEQDDLTLVRQCLEGNQMPSGALIAKHQKAVFNVALRMVKDYQDAQDLAQAVFCQSMRSSTLSTPSTSFLAGFIEWL